MRRAPTAKNCVETQAHRNLQFYAYHAPLLPSSRELYKFKFIDYCMLDRYDSANPLDAVATYVFILLSPSTSVDH